MKTREAFERIRRRKGDRFTLRFRMIFLVQLEIILCLAVAYGVHIFTGKFLPEMNMPDYVMLLIVSTIVGVVVTYFVSKQFFNPIKKLRQAIDRVADGDFSVRLEAEEYSSKEIQEIFAGFNLMAHELSSTEILQTDFVSNVSHEFKTPINAIEGYATLLQDTDGITAEEREQYAEKILFNTQRLSSLVGNILLLSKIGNQAIPANKSTYRLDEQIRQTILLLEPEWTKREVEFDIDMDDTFVFGNENLLHHVWYNLIGNAIKFGPNGGTVRISLKKADGITVFTVEDGGPGIAEDAKKHIFDKFYQGDSSHKQEGNGLGLALVKKILDAVGGTVDAENLDGGGCRFIVRLK